MSCWLTSTALSIVTLGSMKKIFSPDDIEQVSSKDDTKTSLKTVVKETSYLMMMQGMSHILAHPLRVISIAARSILWDWRPSTVESSAPLGRFSKTRGCWDSLSA
ncbi:hypothetical protein J1605_002949 [Eschrichtius robustus]|uniref:Uncharacterized protein n=1 Tax=Eschrichtius robustus TaxID=9764 RepID=A0AB34HTR7_ESCRO|nr:hypothetical protein J1605_002949 [Eschrichtius robustus]